MAPSDRGGPTAQYPRCRRGAPWPTGTRSSACCRTRQRPRCLRRLERGARGPLRRQDAASRPAGQPEGRRRLLWEGQLLTTLHHPHLVRGYEVVEEPRPMVAMETITGYTLSAPWSACAGPGSPRHARRTGRAAVCGAPLPPRSRHPPPRSEAGKRRLRGGQGQGHRPQPCPRPRTRAGGLGTPAYMAPEQDGGDEFTTASDVWAVGLILYEAATGTQPFDQSGSSDRQRVGPRVSSRLAAVGRGGRRGGQPTTVAGAGGCIANSSRGQTRCGRCAGCRPTSPRRSIAVSIPTRRADPRSRSSSSCSGRSSPPLLALEAIRRGLAGPST